jgi:hypothetical protein
MEILRIVESPHPPFAKGGRASHREDRGDFGAQGEDS